MVLSEIQSIIQRDSKDTTYKYALLRATIDISLEEAHHLTINHTKQKVTIPFGLLLERWILYYYPIFESDDFIPQKNGEENTRGRQIAFRSEFTDLIEYYKDQGGYKQFYQEYLRNTLPQQAREYLIILLNKLRNTIKTMPMRYLGKSVYNTEYSIFNPNSYDLKRFPMGKDFDLSRTNIIQASGFFDIPLSYFEAFQQFGGFILGKDSIIYQWAEFTSKAQSMNTITSEKVLHLLNTTPLDPRHTQLSRSIFEDDRKVNKLDLKCVWSGQLIKEYDIDHLIPFAYFQNNDLWNLLPTSKQKNNSKRDKIPSIRLLNEQKAIILNYWKTLVNSEYRTRFFEELYLNLLGFRSDAEQYNDFQLLEQGFQALIRRCNTLIQNHNYEVWEG
jgi:hypothetical protein